MGDRYVDRPGGRHAAWAGVRLRRPAVDPAVPRADRALLTAPGTLLTPACQGSPPRRRDYLPRDPGRRLAAVDGAAIGLTGAMMIAVFGTTPLAVGVLALQATTGWESASSHYALLLAEIIAIITIMVFGFRVALFGQPTGTVPAEVAARTHHGRYLTDQDFDARSRVLLRRAQDAIDAITSSEVCRADLLDQAAVGAALADQEWDIAVALREQAELRARRAELSTIGAGPATAALLARQVQAAQLAESSLAARVGALEHYAAEVREADAAYRDWRQAASLAELHARHVDVLARTAADEHGIAHIEAMAQQARAVRAAFRAPPG
jgi:uncharacterized membrane protein